MTYCPLVPAWAASIHKFQGLEAGFDKYDHIIVGRKVDRCTEDLLIKYRKNGIYTLAFLNDEGRIIEQSLLKNCSNVTDVKLYKNFVAYRNNDSILVSNIFEMRSTTEPHPISSPLSVNDIKMFEDGLNKVLDKFNVEKTSTVDILVVCTVSALIFIYIMIFTVNKRRNVVDFLGALSRHIGGNISTPNVSDIEDEAFAREQNNGSAGQQANISANNASTQVASDQLSGSAPIREESSLQSTIRSNELLPTLGLNRLIIKQLFWQPTQTMFPVKLHQINIQDLRL